MHTTSTSTSRSSRYLPRDTCVLLLESLDLHVVCARTADCCDATLAAGWLPGGWVAGEAELARGASRAMAEGVENPVAAEGGAEHDDEDTGDGSKDAVRDAPSRLMLQFVQPRCPILSL